MRTKPVGHFLRSGGVGELLPQAEKLLALRGRVAALLPPNLRAGTEVANSKGEVLVLQADNNAVAAKLKHHAPGILSGLAHAGYHYQQLKVDVRPAAERDAPARRMRLIPDAAGAALSRLEGQLPDGPLRDAVHKLARKTR